MRNNPVRRFTKEASMNDQPVASNLSETDQRDRMPEAACQDGNGTPPPEVSGLQSDQPQQHRISEVDTADASIQDEALDIEGRPIPCRPSGAPSGALSQMRMRQFYNSNRPRRNTNNLDEEFNRLRIRGAPARAPHNAACAPVGFQHPGGYTHGDQSSLPTPVQPLLQPQPLYPQHQAQMNGTPQFLQLPQGSAVSYQALPVYWLNGAGGPQYVLFTTTAQQMCAVIPDAFLRQHYVTPQPAETVEPFHFIPVISEVVGPMYEQPPMWMGPTGPVNYAFTQTSCEGPSQQDERLNAGYGLQPNCKECLLVPVNPMTQQYTMGDLPSTGCQFCPPEQIMADQQTSCPAWPPNCGQAPNPPPEAPIDSYQNVVDGALETEPQFTCVDESGPVDSMNEDLPGRLSPAGRMDATVQWRREEDSVHSDHSDLSPNKSRRPRGSNDPEFANYSDRRGQIGISSPICRSAEKRSSGGSDPDLATEKEADSSPSSIPPAADSRAISPWSNASTNDSLTCSLATASTGCQSGDGNRNNWAERRLYSRVFYNRARRRIVDSPTSAGRESQSPQRAAPFPTPPKPTVRWRKMQHDYQGQRRFSLDYAATDRTGDGYDRAQDRFGLGGRNATPNERNRRANTRFNL